jgi:hypothetical protein
MSNPVPRRPTPPPTRQQLDELEALMQRMLALPVNTPDGEPHSRAPEAMAKPATPALPAVVEPEAAAAVARAEIARLLLPPPPPEDEPLPAAAPSREAPEDSSVMEPLPRSDEHFRTTTVRRSRQVGWWLRPLLWSNRTFDRCTVHLGKRGRWLRGPRGRAWLGWTGLFFLVTAVAWSVIDWMGWPW